MVWYCKYRKIVVPLFVRFFLQNGDQGYRHQKGISCVPVTEGVVSPSEGASEGNRNFRRVLSRIVTFLALGSQKPPVPSVGVVGAAAEETEGSSSCC